MDINNIYTSEKEIPVHIKIMSKNKFIQFYEDDLRGGFIHRIFASSRLVFLKIRILPTVMITEDIILILTEKDGTWFTLGMCLKT